MPTIYAIAELNDDETSSVGGGLSWNIMKDMNDAYVYAKEAWAEFDQGFAEGSR